jgi:hypothetical protein
LSGFKNGDASKLAVRWVLIVHNSTHGVYVAHVYAGFVGGFDDLNFAALVKLHYCQARVLARLGVAFVASGPL